MKRSLAAVLLAGALAAHAQAPPDVPPVTPPPVESTPAPASQAPLPEAEGAAAAPPAAPAAPAPAPEPPRVPAAKAPPPRPPPPKSSALSSPAGERDTDVAALRREVARLQSELDAERAAALPPAEEPGSVPPPMRAAWGWLVAVALLALASGFALGWRLLDRRIRRKYGGLRIY